MSPKFVVSALLCLIGTASVMTGQTGTTKPPATTDRKWPFDAAEARRRQQEAARTLAAQTEVTLDVGRGVKMKLVLIPAGTFVMGSPSTEKGRREEPRHTVTISKTFWMSVTEVTQAQWLAVMNTSPWRGRKDVKQAAECPAANISWNGASAFCTRLGQTIRSAGWLVRLPTEAEWEYACRAGSGEGFCFGDDESKLSDYAWHVKNTVQAGGNHAQPVAQKKPNAWGLYDMHGNVFEWCMDWYGQYGAADATATDPGGPTSGRMRVLRGGAFNVDDLPRCAARDWSLPGNQESYTGFRVVAQPAAASSGIATTGGPRSAFFGGGANAHHIVYVIDRSGSMVETLDTVRTELLISISRLAPKQDFHLIMFAKGLPLEVPARRLMPATAENKEAAAKFLESVRAMGQSDPIPALQRAFAVLARADKRPGRLIYLLTDGNFPDNAAVLAVLRKLNGGKQVAINTYLYGRRPPEAEKVMRQIAKEHGGRYRYVSADE